MLLVYQNTSDIPKHIELSLCAFAKPADIKFPREKVATAVGRTAVGEIVCSKMSMDYRNIP